MAEDRNSFIFRLLLTLFVILAINFFLPRMMPGDPFSTTSADEAGEEIIVMTEEQRLYYMNYYGLDRPLHEQFLVYMKNLMKGDLAARTLRTVADNVECPSLSPDGTRIAFKHAIDGDPTRGWRLSVLDLASLAVTPLAETASVDDQPAWLSGDTVGYTLRQADGRPDVWSVPATGGGTPRLLVPGAESPAALAGVAAGTNG